MPPERIAVEVVRVDDAGLVRLELALPRGSTLHQALERARASGVFGESLVLPCRAGVFGRERAPDTLLRDGDRVEIYRPLVEDPKSIRRRRAAARAGSR